jgi:hypothetical protein
MIRLRPGPDPIAGPLTEEAEDTLRNAYEYLQIWIGLIAFTLPIVLVLGNWALGGSLQGSISAYYYTEVHAWFIGSQFALGVFFLSYNYRPLDRYGWDNVASNVACVAMIVVALIPTVEPGGDSSFGSVFHLVAAAIVFALLAWFAYFRFTMSGAGMTDRKRARNVLYRACGVIILVALLAAALFSFALDGTSWHSTLVFETIAIFAFGASWLVKGGFLGILADR